MKNNTLTFILILFGFLSKSFAQQSPTFFAQKLAIQETSVFSHYFTDFQVFSLDSRAITKHCQAEPETSFSLWFSDEESYHCTLKKNDLRTSNYRNFHLNDAGKQQMHKAACITYKGSTNDGAALRATIKNGFMTFMIQEDGRTIFIENANRFLPYLNDDTYVRYEAGASRPLPDNFCASTDIFSKKMQLNAAATIQNRSTSPSGCTKVNIAIASDFLMWQKYGSNTEAHNLTVLNNVNTDFDTDFGHEIQYFVSEQIVSTSANNPAEQTWSATTDATTLLANFRAWSIIGGFVNAFDLGEFWTDRDLNGPTVGLAYSPGICSIHKYHILQDYSTDANTLRVLTSHEIGHNWGCMHDPTGANTMMAPQVNNTTLWSAASINALDERNGSVNCNVLEGAPIARFHINTTECKNTVIELLDLSNRSPNAWDWNMPTGTPDSANTQNASVQYNSTGIKTIALTASNAQCTGTSSHSLTKTFEVVDMQGPPSTCAIGLVNSSTNTNYQTGIQVLQLDSLNSQSGSTYQDGAVYLNRTCSDFVTIEEGTHNIWLQVGPINQEHIDIYLDYNNDGDFDDANEHIADNVQTTGSLASIAFTTPDTGILYDVLLRMRVMSDFNPINSACQTPSYGQVEDFGVIIASPEDCAIQIEGIQGFCTDPSSAVIGWEVDKTAERHRIQYREQGSTVWNPRILVGGFPRNHALLRNLNPNTTYEYKIRQECSSAIGPYSQLHTFTTYSADPCSTPSSTHYTYRPNGNPTLVKLFCSYEPEASNKLVQVRWKTLNATAWDRKVVSKSFYLVQDLIPNTYYIYQFRAKCGSTWTTWTPRDTFLTLPVPMPFAPQQITDDRADDKYEHTLREQNVDIFPNPFETTLQLSATSASIEKIEIFDSRGAVVFEKKAQDATVFLQLAALSSGLYQLKAVLDDGGVVCRKIVKL